MKRLLFLAAGALLLSPVFAHAQSSTSCDNADDSANCPSDNSGSMNCEDQNCPQPGAPQAQQQPAYVAPPPAAPAPAASATASTSTHHQVGPPAVDVRGGPGFMTFTGQNAAFFDPGAAYGVGLQINAPRGAPLGLELGYQGNLYSLQQGNIFHNGTVWENGGQALLRVGPTYSRVQPYALGGYNVTNVATSGNANDRPGVVQGGWIQKVPTGAGVDVRVTDGAHPFTLGARGTYDFVLNGDNVFKATSNGSHDDQIGAQLLFGGQF